MNHDQHLGLQANKIQEQEKSVAAYSETARLRLFTVRGRGKLRLLCTEYFGHDSRSTVI